LIEAGKAGDRIILTETIPALSGDYFSGRIGNMRVVELCVQAGLATHLKLTQG
jgi:hypothetical protein